MSGLKGFSSRKSQFMPCGEAQRRLSVTKEGRALGLTNWMALAIPSGARETRPIIKFPSEWPEHSLWGLTETEISLCSILLYAHPFVT